MLIVGAGQGRPAGVLDRDHTSLYDRGLVLEWDGERLHERFVWSGPLKGASWDGDRLLLCSDRALLWVDSETWQLVDQWTHPWLNDVHHALRFACEVWVANTGLDAVLRVGDRPELIGVRGEVRPPEGDVRGRSLEHGSHPNHLFVHGGKLWVTRFHDRDAISLDGDRMPLERERPHDGLSRPDGVWFTTVDGQLLCWSAEGVGAVRIEPPDADPEPLGWCRGLWFEQDRAWVGFTRIRATRARQNLAWARGALRGSQVATRRPTRVVRVGLDGALLQTVRVDEVGMDAVFAILG